MTVAKASRTGVTLSLAKAWRAAFLGIVGQRGRNPWGCQRRTW